MIRVLIFIKGMLLGVANIIPGVSGGTFALILGIYERLVASIQSFGLKTLKVLGEFVKPPRGKSRRRVFSSELHRTDAGFLLLLLLGAGVAVLLSSRLIAFLLEQHRAPTLAFFVGLIVPSILVPYGLLERRSVREVLSCLAGLAGMVCLTVFLKPTGQAGLGLTGLFLSGAVASSAMILPGISGSFVLMVMGEYQNVLDAINTWDLVRIAVFGLGCLVGLCAFVRLLHYLLKRYHSITLAFLIGLILGSLWVLWPFKEVAQGAKLITGTNVLPSGLESEVAWSIGAMLMGLVCSLGLHLLGKKQTEPTKQHQEEMP